eukprot:5012499-Amphidinium_carterae.1
MELEMPDTQILFHALRRCVSKLTESNREMDHRMQSFMMQQNFPQDMSQDGVKIFFDYLWGEVRYHDVTDESQQYNLPYWQ